MRAEIPSVNTDIYYNGKSLDKAMKQSASYDLIYLDIQIKQRGMGSLPPRISASGMRMYYFPFEYKKTHDQNVQNNQKRAALVPFSYSVPVPVSETVYTNANFVASIEYPF